MVKKGLKTLLADIMTEIVSILDDKSNNDVGFFAQLLWQMKHRETPFDVHRLFCVLSLCRRANGERRDVSKHIRSDHDLWGAQKTRILAGEVFGNPFRAKK